MVAEIVNLREKWEVNASIGPAGTHWKFAANTDPRLVQTYSQLAYLLDLTARKTEIDQAGRNAIKALLDLDVIIGHNDDPNWTAPFANDQQKWISFPKLPENQSDNLYQYDALHELSHMLHNSQVLRVSRESAPAMSVFLKSWTSNGHNADSATGSPLTPEKIASMKHNRQVYGYYDFDYEYNATWGINYVDRLVRGTDAQKRDRYSDIPEYEKDTFWKVIDHQIQTNHQPGMKGASNETGVEKLATIVNQNPAIAEPALTVYRHMIENGVPQDDAAIAVVTSLENSPIPQQQESSSIGT